NFPALQLGTVVPPARQATFECSFIPAEPMGGAAVRLVINLNYEDSAVRARVSGKQRNERVGFLTKMMPPFADLVFLVCPGERVPGCRLQPDGDRHRERRRPGWRDVRTPAFPPPPPPPLSVLAAVILILLLFFLRLSIFTYVFLSALGLLIIIGLHQLLESRKRRRPAPKVEMGTSSHDGVDLSWIPQETLNQINKASPKRSPRKRSQRASAGSDE
ncbi:unnamed protein product, partial [Tetraodon nigroviridis]